MGIKTENVLAFSASTINIMHWEYFFGLEVGPLSAQPCGFALCVFC